MYVCVSIELRLSLLSPGRTCTSKYVGEVVLRRSIHGYVCYVDTTVCMYTTQCSLIHSQEQCGLSDRILQIIQRHNLKEPFPIQKQAIPAIMCGR